MSKTNDKVFELSVPTTSQIVSGAERVLAVFLVSAFAAWKLYPHQFSRAALLSAGTAGAVAVYQFLLSSITTL